MFCLDTYLRESEDYEIHMTRSGFKDCARFIEKNAPEVVHVNPGEKIVGARIIGIPPVPIGINEEKGTIILPYTKPCYGTATVEVPVPPEEREKIRAVGID
ncbi:DUF1894 domain-containing protein [Methanobacterium sp.]|uniref:DUF1894 domain-containing protein n=1 Tax=Methanobacterium sp. TaxID=2164 RepID=UPI002ABBD644|nr:DUF1894 domain-containing protein [Methanobacterium sp.]MDY9923363.1 DUF1894 domain-containing protein [Methanobacterium sp.]